jgi:hypothetical protein
LAAARPPVATTVAAAPPPTVPLAVLGTNAKRFPATGIVRVHNPFTAANITGLVALVLLGASMALYARVRVARAGSPISG